MTAVVADSAAIVWWLSDDARLSLAAVKALQAADVGDGIFISAVTLVDIWYATHKRRGALAAEQLAELDHTIRDPDVNVHVLPLTVAVARRAWEPTREAMPDPFDRIILATAHDRGIPLVTPDGVLRGLELHATIW